MEFRETLLAAQRNQQQKSSGNAYYKARFDPPKKEKELKPKDRLSANIQKFLQKKEEEERQKELDAKRKRDELMAMRDSKAMNKIRKTLKVIKSANKSVLSDAIDTENTAFTLEGPHQPDQDDYGYESQEAAAIYQRMMEKYSKIPEESKFPKNNKTATRKDIKGTRERVKNALQQVDEPVPHKRRRVKDCDEDKDISPPPSRPEAEKKKEDKPKLRKPMPPPMDFNQLLKLAEQKKMEPVEPLAVAKKVIAESEPARPMTKRQRKEYEEELARKMRRQQETTGRKVATDAKPTHDRERKPDVSNRIPKLGDKDRNGYKERTDKLTERDRHIQNVRSEMQIRKEKLNETERLDRMRMKQNIETKNLNKSQPNIKTMDNKDKINVSKDNYKKNIELKSQNTYRIDKNVPDKKVVNPNRNIERSGNGYNSLGRPVPKQPDREEIRDKIAKQKLLNSNNDSSRVVVNGKQETKKNIPVANNKVPFKSRPDERKPVPNDRTQPSSSKPKISNSFDFDKHLNSLGKARKPNGASNMKRVDDRKKPMQKRRVLDSEDDDSEMDDFIDDGDQDEDYSKHIKEIFGYDKSKYKDDDDDPDMESSFARQMREEYISKKIGIMEDLEDMKMEAMEKKLKGKKKRRISDDD